MRLSKKERLSYQNKEAIASYCMSNFGGIAIIDIIYDTDDYIVWYDSQIEIQKRKIHVSKVYYTSNGGYFLIYGSKKVSLSECLNVYV